MPRENCLAGVNGGYFDPENNPVGLVISDGKVVAPLRKASLLSGVMVALNGRIQLLRAAEYFDEIKNKDRAAMRPLSGGSGPAGSRPQQYPAGTPDLCYHRRTRSRRHRVLFRSNAGSAWENFGYSRNHSRLESAARAQSRWRIVQRVLVRREKTVRSRSRSRRRCETSWRWSRSRSHPQITLIYADFVGSTSCFP